MTVEKLWAEHEAGLEDFWGRRENGPRFVHAFTLFGRPIRVTSNDEQLLTAVALARPQYSLAPTTTHTPFTVHLVVRATPVDPGPPPQNLLAHNQYTGHDQWLSIQMGGWGHCHINLAQGEAIAVLALPGLPTGIGQPRFAQHHLYQPGHQCQFCHVALHRLAAW
ncbi:MAG: hypothetical protein IPL78_09135 [Chloroflexi bacterium]|nr:hypothetical protein [Chloroflexota bacterium]